MTYEIFVERVMRKAGFQTREAAVDAIAATLRVLRECVDDAQRAAISERLPKQLSEILDAGTGELVGIGVPAFYSQVQREEAAKLSTAVEHAQVVCQTLAQAVGANVVDGLPQALSELFDVTATAAGIVTPPPERLGRGHTLATGRGGSEHPVSEDAPPPHHHDAVASTNPYDDRKLSSGHPNTERSLSEGRPGSRRPVSDYHED